MSAHSPHDAEPSDWEEPAQSVGHSEVRVSRPGPLARPTLAAGTMVGGRYRVVGTLGRGGFGVVYEAEHVELQRPVALKVLNSELTEDPTLYSRFQQEARTAAAIGHPNIVQIFDLGHDEAGAFIAMEKLEGEELASRIARAHPLPEAWVARIGAELAAAMAPAHERGVIHRDIKPQNVFLARGPGGEEVVKVIDFGIAKLLDLRVKEGDLTATGQLCGTPRFMAPEQFRSAREVDARADIYAIGALLYRSLTGSYPFDAPTYPELLLMIMSDQPKPLRAQRPDVSERMEQIVAKAMAKDPDARFATARELADVLLEHAERLERARSLPPAAEPSVSVEETASPSSRLPLLGLLALGALFIGALAFVGVSIVVFGGTSDDTSAARASMPPEEAAPPAPRPQPTTFRVAVTVEPSSAELSLDGVPIGHGSFERELPRDGRAHTLIARAEGHAPATITFVDTPPEERVELTPLPSTERVVAAPVPAAASEPAPSPPATERAPRAESAQRRPRPLPPTAPPPLPTARPLATPPPQPPARGAHSAPIVY